MGFSLCSIHDDNRCFQLRCYKIHLSRICTEKNGLFIVLKCDAYKYLFIQSERCHSSSHKGNHQQQQQQNSSIANSRKKKHTPNRSLNYIVLDRLCLRLFVYFFLSESEENSVSFLVGTKTSAQIIIIIIRTYWRRTSFDRTPTIKKR